MHVRIYSYGMVLYAQISSKRHTCRTKGRQTTMQSRTVIHYALMRRDVERWRAGDFVRIGWQGVFGCKGELVKTLCKRQEQRQSCTLKSSS